MTELQKLNLGEMETLIGEKVELSAWNTNKGNLKMVYIYGIFNLEVEDGWLYLYDGYDDECNFSIKLDEIEKVETSVNEVADIHINDMCISLCIADD